jgi:hypothetical protein
LFLLGVSRIGGSLVCLSFFAIQLFRLFLYFFFFPFFFFVLSLANQCRMQLTQHVFNIPKP